MSAVRATHRARVESEEVVAAATYLPTYLPVMLTVIMLSKAHRDH